MSTFQPKRRSYLPGGGMISTLTIALSILLIFLHQTVMAQATRVTGTIVNSTGEAVGFASVAVKGGSAAVVADEKGAFAINAPSNATIIITSVGYERQEVNIEGRSTLKITLVSTASSLQDVVVIGYGTQRKEAVTGSVASISGAAMREVPSANVSQALQGRMAGVQMAQTSSRPGAAMQIRIRGARSLTATNDPLIVLDGIPFPGSIADLNPDDIKSVDVLKDASATAIYGSRGANGVILITTNKGQKGAKPRVAYNGYAGNQTVFARYPMMNAREFTTLKQVANRFPALGVDEDSSGKVNTDWQDLLYRTGTLNSHDISVTGAGEGGSYNAGMGYYRNQGVIPTQRYTRYSFRAAVDQLIGKHIRIGFTTNNNYNISEGSQVNVNLMLSPLANPYKADGSTKRIVNTTLGDNYVLTKGIVDSLTDNGLWLNETRNFATYNSAYGEVQIPGVNGLKYRVNLGLDFIQGNNGNYTAQGVNSVNAATESTAGISNSQTYHWTVENILSYDRTFAEKHSVNVTALYSAEQQKFNTSSMAAKGIPSDAFQFYNLGNATGEITVNPANQGYYMWGLMSWMGRVMYAYDNRYMISATVRSDGSSRLAPGHQWHTYPAVSAGWNVANEAFMQNVKWLNALKLRAGFGQTSNQAINPYATLGALSTRPYNFGSDNYSIGYYVTQLPNASLGWEYSKTWNYGIDFGLFKNRLTGTVEYYVTKTNDLLQSVGLPQTSGVNSYTANVGKTENKGVEITLNGSILDGGRDGVSWDAGFNLYANRNKLVALASGSTKDEGNGWFVGHNINSVYDYQKIGLWQAKDPYLNILEPGGSVGMIKVLYTGGYNDDGTPKRAIGADDRQVMDLDPKFMGGFNTRVAYKGFDLTAVGVFQHGGKLISTVYGSGGYLNTLTTRNNNIKVDYWTPENTDAKYPNPAGPLSGDNPKYGTTLGYFDASFLKVRTISLGYDFSRSVIKSKSIKMRAYFTVQNPFVIWSPYTKESGMDPETNSYGNENAAVPLSGSLRRLLTIGVNTPATRNYILGVNLSF
ncbi:TonB-linked outer membrane protein, SusC/RagA family [Chitinophaga jiangningensis]|uniref:TonB-linked outer membrane protein, SusC/RagA family n=2 Tax=Chitinophaga jiangningensis TaxID=1419482 RepID=A0A1M7CGR6_9BACT|nr:TonB-linked outer membrane protein, SusC/RagA family [Chitinophaga jiangningensis]